MPRYCLDTSWITNPLLDMPPDVHVTLWARIKDLLEDGAFCWNEDIWGEIDGSISDDDVGQCLGDLNGDSCYEIGSDNWNWKKYLEHIERVRVQYKDYISEYNGGRKNTVGLIDCSIVCFAKTLNLPVASMEKPNRNPSIKRIRIPELCEREGVGHFDLTEILRAEDIKV